MTSGDGGNVNVDPTDWHYVYGTYFAPPAQIYRMTDGGGGFFQNKFILNGINVNDRAEFYMPLVLNQQNPNQLFTGTYRVYRSDNAKEPAAGDVLWSLISPDLTSHCTGPAPNGARNCTLTAIGLGGGTGVYAGTNDGLLWVSPDGQTSSNPTWIQLGHSGQNGSQDGTHSDVWLPQRPVSGIAVDRSNWRIAYVAYNGFDAATSNRPGHVFKTTDGGQTFQNITSNLPDTPVNWLVLDPAFPDTIYAATDVGPGSRSAPAFPSSVSTRSTWTPSTASSPPARTAAAHGRSTTRRRPPPRWCWPASTPASRSVPPASSTTR